MMRFTTISIFHPADALRGMNPLILQNRSDYTFLMAARPENVNGYYGIAIYNGASLTDRVCFQPQW
jgi:hypothetical protein